MARALLIGIDHYYDIGPLQGPKGDVADLKEWLLSQGVDPIDELLSPGGQDVFTATPRSEDVGGWLDRLAAEAAKIKRQNDGEDVPFPLGDRLYVFFAGHGYNAFAAGPTGIFPRTTVENWDVLPFTPLHTTLKHLAYFREIILIVDACREVIDYSMEPSWNRRTKPRSNAGEVKTMLIQAASSGEKTKEDDFDGRIRGVLSQAFLAGVSGLAAENGRVTAEKLKGHIITAVKSKLKTNPKIDADDPIVICHTDVIDAQISIDCDGPIVGAVLRRNTGGENPVDLSQGKNVFAVPPGAYTLEIPGREPIDIHAVWRINHVKV